MGKSAGAKIAANRTNKAQTEFCLTFIELPLVILDADEGDRTSKRLLAAGDGKEN